MVTSILTLVPPAGVDVRAEIRNARLARDRVQALVTLLQSQRSDASATLLKTLAADFAALKDAPNKAFADTEFTKYSAWSTADQDFGKRIDAFESLEPLIDAYVDELAAGHRAEIVAILTEERDTLEAQLDKEEADTTAVEARIQQLDVELAKWSTSAKAKTTRPRKAAKSPASRRGKAVKKRGGRP